MLIRGALYDFNFRDSFLRVPFPELLKNMRRNMRWDKGLVFGIFGKRVFSLSFFFCSLLIENVEEGRRSSSTNVRTFLIMLFGWKRMEEVEK